MSAAGLSHSCIKRLIQTKGVDRKARVGISRSWILDPGSWILDFVEVMIKEVLGIRHPVSSIQHQPVKCTHLSIPAMPAEKILCKVRVLSVVFFGGFEAQNGMGFKRKPYSELFFGSR
jgi:hypothetical protein